MNLAHVVWREIAHRKLNFVLALASVVGAVACGVGLVTLLRGQEIQSAQRVKGLDDEIRKITKNMGFNVFILPKEQDLADFHAADFGAKTMPEDYVQRLAQSKDVIKVNHLRPALIRKLNWPEKKQPIILMGVRGIVPLVHRNLKKPLAQPVPPGKIDLGHVLAHQHDLQPGKSVLLMGETFAVNKVYPPRGTKDDITAWIDLSKAQELLGLEGRINMIQALECNCSSVDRLAEIDNEVSKVLGGQVQVIELSTMAIARAKARTKVHAEGQATLAIGRRRATVVIPSVMVGAGVWVGLLSLANVRARRQEIGILRAMGIRTSQVLRIFLAKAALIGIIGAVVGYGCGFAAAVALESNWHAGDDQPVPAAWLFVPKVLVAVLVLTPLLTVLSGWLPAWKAATQDPAEVLRQQ